MLATFVWSACIGPVLAAFPNGRTSVGAGRARMNCVPPRPAGGKTIRILSVPPTHAPSVGPESGPSYPWEVTYAGTNTGNGNKLTTVPIVGWTALGGLPVQMTLFHNSQGASA